MDKNFQVDDAVLAEFKKFLTSQNIRLDRRRPERRDGLAEGQHQGQDPHQPVRPVAGPAHPADWDPMIQKALTFLPEAQALEDNAHKVLTQKAMARNGEQ